MRYLDFKPTLVLHPLSCMDTKLGCPPAGVTRACWSEQSKSPGRKYPLRDRLTQFRAKQPPSTACGSSLAFFFSAYDARLRPLNLTLAHPPCCA